MVFSYLFEWTSFLYDVKHIVYDVNDLSRVDLKIAVSSWVSCNITQCRFLKNKSQLISWTLKVRLSI